MLNKLCILHRTRVFWTTFRVSESSNEAKYEAESVNVFQVCFWNLNSFEQLEEVSRFNEYALN